MFCFFFDENPENIQVFYLEAKANKKDYEPSSTAVVSTLMPFLLNSILAVT